MSVYAVIGGSGTIGRHIVAALQEGGAEVRALSRHSPTHPVDLRTGAGLEAALAGCAVIIDAANGPSRAPEPVLVAGAGRLTDAAAAAGVAHLVCVSIVGCDEVPARYYRAKVAQEARVRSGGVAWTIVRSTQFHELVGAGLDIAARWRISPRSRARLQPVSAAEAAVAVADLAKQPPTGRTVNVAGPEVLELSELARRWQVVRRRRGLPVALPLPPALGRPLRAGALTCAAPDVAGRVRFEDWLTQPS